MFSPAVTPYIHHFAPICEDEIYSSSSGPNPMEPIHQYARYSDLLHQDAQSVVLYSSSPPLLPPPSPPRKQLRSDLPDDEEIQRRENFVRRKEWMKWVTKWIAQTEFGGNRKSKFMDSIPESTEEQRYSEEVLYVASPPSLANPFNPFVSPAGSGFTPSSSPTWSSPSSKSTRRLSHGTVSSLESISEVAEEQ